MKEIEGTRCDCGMFESCEVCVALAQRDLGPYTVEDYARSYSFEVPPDPLAQIIADMAHEKVEREMLEVLRAESESSS